MRLDIGDILLLVAAAILILTGLGVGVPGDDTNWLHLGLGVAFAGFGLHDTRDVVGGRDGRLG